MNRIFSTDFRKIRKYKFSRMAVQWGPSCSMRANGRAEGRDKANSRFFVILRMCLKKTEHSRDYFLNTAN